MNSTKIIEGTLQADGVTLCLVEKVALSPGRVSVTVQPLSPSTGPTMLEVLDRIHQSQRQRGRSPMTEDKMGVEIEQLLREDDNYDDRWQEIWSQADTKPASDKI